MKDIFVKNYLLFVVVLCICACTDVVEEDGFMEEFPAMTKSQVLSWENCDECILPSGAKVFLPWYTNTKACIPNDIRNDIKAVDGWTILDTTVDIIDCEEEVTDVDPGCNYLLMYNTKIGFLKGFYYVEENVDNNYGFWCLETTSPTKLFNFVPEFAIPISEVALQKVTVSNLTRTFQTQGFDPGWNCFVLELSYDENSDQQRLDVSAFAMNRAQVTLTGNYEGGGNGTIVSVDTKNSNPIKGFVQHIGEDALGWMIDELTDDDEKDDDKEEDAGGINIPDALLTSLPSTFQKIFNSFSFRKQSPTSYNFAFTAKGQAVITGEIVTASSGIISPITGLKLGSAEMDLGVWNLESQPLHQICNEARLIGITGPHRDQFSYAIRTEPKCVIKVNPLIKQPYSFMVLPSEGNDTIPIYADDIISGENKWNMSYGAFYDPETEFYYYEGVYKSKDFDWDYLMNKYWEDAWPNYTLADENNSPGYSFSYYQSHDVDVTRHLTYRILYRNNSDGTCSGKTFIPKQVVGYGIIGGHPTTWHSVEELKQHGITF